jgi:hypothetical protein
VRDDELSPEGQHLLSIINGSEEFTRDGAAFVLSLLVAFLHTKGTLDAREFGALLGGFRAENVTEGDPHDDMIQRVQGMVEFLTRPASKAERDGMI